MTFGLPFLPATSRHAFAVPLSALSLAITMAAIIPAHAEPATDAASQSATATHAFNIPAQSLGEALIQFGQQSGLEVSTSNSLIADKKSSMVSGTLTTEQALNRLLGGTSLRYSIHGGMVSLMGNDQGGSLLAPISVSAGAVSTGRAADGYVVTSPNAVGPWEGRTLQDTPYSVSVYSEELMENLQASSPDQVYRVNPTTQLVRPQHENDQPRIMMRGFSVQKSYRDGVPSDQYNHATTTEDVERIEILNGLSGFLYGANNIGGVTNYITKRSTEERLNQLTLSSLGNESWYVHGDFGGKFDSDGRFGYRANLVEQGGETTIKRQEIEKSFYSLALDGQLTDSFWLQVHGMKRTYDVNGSQAYWYFGPGVSRPSANRIDNDISWGQPWTNRWYDYDRYGVNMKWEVNENLAFRAAYLENSGTRGSESASNTITSSTTYDQTISGVFADGVDRLLSEQRDKGAAVYADLAFDTGSVFHKLTTGFQYNDSRQYRMDGANAANITFTDLPLDSPTVIDRPSGIAPVDRGRKHLRSHSQYRNIVIGDDIHFNEKWSALLGAAHTTITVKSGDGYEESAITPSASLLYKPVDNLTTYVSYIEALETGGTAADDYNGTPVANAGEVFEPLISNQIELGAKTTLGGVALNTALYRIDKGLQYYDVSNPSAPRYVQDGRQIHQGVEITATGKISDNVSILGGYTWIDASVEEQKQSPELEGKRPSDVAEHLFKLRGEYAIPQVQDLSVSAGMIYNGSSYGDTLNTDKVPGYALFDLGARYKMTVAEKPLTLRMDLHNVFNKHYWNGFNGSRIGEPRTLLLSASLKL